MDEIMDHEDESEITAQAVLNVIQEAWLNEKLCPELLPNVTEYVEIMMEQVEQMEANVSQLENTDLRSLIHKQEIERIKYLIRSYLRFRLEKIETYSLSLFKNPGVLSAEEMKFLKEYTTITVEALKSLCQNMPGPTGQLNSKQLEISPDLNAFVFVKSKEALSDAIIVQDGVNEEEVIIEKDSQHILPYNAVKEHIRNSTMVLM
ncbi:DNA replication complex GINS protein SLD5 isoform X3 [Halyomorpha halys]|uniref:DNA replication complex GINS protein SLD5 isoform X3 n=1 Tax=Halyomorpha halys TaxID=286706 RepID=UPI0006D52329|nr:DNA replication complex GINS protein SLD5-like isoform X3 [Halyomorpha halys]